jgi:hypothetical protein
MPSKLLAAALISSAMSVTHASAAPESNRDPLAISAIEKMGAHLRQLRSFDVKVDSSVDLVLANGQLIQKSFVTSLQADRPSQLHALINGERDRPKEVFYDGKTFTLYSARDRYYATAQAPASLDELIPALQTKYGIELPLADLFAWGTDRAPTSRISDAYYVGDATIGGTPCSHYAFRQGDADWQLWVTQGDNPLPRQLVIVDRSDKARPQYIARFNWASAPRFAPETFAFKAPADAQPIVFHTLTKGEGR